MTDPIDTIHLENAVGSASIDQELDLEQLAKDLPNSEFTPDQFPGLLYRTSEPRATNLVFRSGKIVITGATQLEELDRSIAILLDDLSTLGIPVPAEPDVTVQNIVSSADLGESLNLNAIAIGLGLESIEYEPEQFPGLVYRLDDPPVVVLLFGSGKVVVTGATTLADVETAVSSVAETLHDLGMVG